jgi:16S rRNA (cytosine1402-N4)-methyltransferase
MLELLDDCAMEDRLHIPVMLHEVLEYLRLAPGKTIVDATAGMGGHSREICRLIMPGGRLICIDRDQDSLAEARKNLGDYSASCEFVHGNFIDLDRILSQLGVGRVDGMLFDLGISSFQLDDPQRGFSFQGDGPLDMRLDRDNYISAYDLVNNLNEDEISHLLKSFGQERWHRRIARFIVEERQRSPISTTAQLSTLVVRAIPARFRQGHWRIHPATRTFQAVRIAVNRELEALEDVLEKATGLLGKGGRICVISFHSLEDRIVKLAFRKASAEGKLGILTNKPLGVCPAEAELNPRSRSAKFRAAEKL